MTPSWPARFAGAATSSLGVSDSEEPMHPPGTGRVAQSMLSLADLTEATPSVVSAPAK